MDVDVNDAIIDDPNINSCTTSKTTPAVSNTISNLRKILPAGSANPPIISFNTSLTKASEFILPPTKPPIVNKSLLIKNESNSGLSIIPNKLSSDATSIVKVINLSKDKNTELLNELEKAKSKTSSTSNLRINSMLPSTPVILHTPKFKDTPINAGKRPLITLTVPTMSLQTNAMKQKKEELEKSGLLNTEAPSKPLVQSVTLTIPKVKSILPNRKSAIKKPCKIEPNVSTQVNRVVHSARDKSSTVSLDESDQSYTLSIAEDECVSVSRRGKSVLAVENTNISSILNQVVDVADGFLLKDGEQTDKKVEPDRKDQNESLMQSLSDGTRVISCPNKSVAEKICETSTENKECTVEPSNSNIESISKDLTFNETVKSNENNPSLEINVEVVPSNLIKNRGKKMEEVIDSDSNGSDTLKCLEEFMDTASNLDENSPPKTKMDSKNASIPESVGEIKLNGSSMHFKRNEFNALEVISKKALNFDETKVQNSLDELKKIKPCFLDLLSKCGGPDMRNDIEHETDEYKDSAFGESIVQNFNDRECVDMEDSNSKDKSSFDNKENECDNMFDGKVPWLDQRLQFSWVKYIDYCQRNEDSDYINTPLKLFQSSFPSGRNLFQSGMKLEAIDPLQQNLFCVVTVVDVMGYRIKLHFDGYSDVHDFWTNADSPDIFPAGWCDDNNMNLSSPPGTTRFTWQGYLDHCKSIAAPKSAFQKNTSSKCTDYSNDTHRSIIKSGMKLEAEDRKNNCISVATVKEVIEGRLLIHFDGWDNTYDFWCDSTSPYVRPIGWCSKNNTDLLSPKDYPTEFNWYDYLRETNSIAVPARAFKTREPKSFKVNMKVEAVDRRNPMLVRVATIADVDKYQIKLSFDGWESAYDYWVDDDCLDIHPPTWCQKTGHPLQSPIHQEMANIFVNGCGVFGCKGYGHVKGIYTTHHSAFGCPYSSENINKEIESFIPQRIVVDDKKCKKNGTKSVLLDLGVGILDDEDSLKKRVRKRRRFFDEISSGNSKAKLQKMEENGECTSQTNNTEDGSNCPKSEENMSVDAQIHQSVFCSAGKLPVEAPVHSWKHLKHLFVPLGDLKKSDVENWTIEEVQEKLQCIPGCSNIDTVSQCVDGESLVLLTQDDLLNTLGMRLGQALKVMAFIRSLR